MPTLETVTAALEAAVQRVGVRDAMAILDAIDLLNRYDDALRLMVYQYCTLEVGEQEILNNRYMCAGETAFEVLGFKNGDPADGIIDIVEERGRASSEHE